MPKQDDNKWLNQGYSKCFKALYYIICKLNFVRLCIDLTFKI